MDFNGQFNDISIFDSEQGKDNLNLWSSTNICFDTASHLDSFPILDSSNCIPMNSTLPDSSALLPIYQYFSDSNSVFTPHSPPELIQSPPYSPNLNSVSTTTLTLSAPVFTTSGIQPNNQANYTPILPNGIPQPEIATDKQFTTSKRKINPDREANRAALLAAAAKDPKLAAKLESEEDKRRRNTAASARFRIKKKLREEALEKTTKEMSIKASLLENKVKELEMEVKWLQGLLIDKDPTFVNLVPPFKRQCK